MRGFRFGVSLRTVGGPAEWYAKCRRAEELGYDVIAVSDHIGPGRPAPFPAFAAAAAVTERIRFTPFVLNVPFYNPTLLAREVRTTAALTGDRLELGVGAGHMKSEFDDAGLPWLPAGERIDVLERALGELRRRFAEEDTPAPPLLIAGNSDGVLALAARHAAIAGFSGLRQAPGHPPGTFHLATAAELDERVAFFREQAGERAAEIESNLLIQHVARTGDPRAELDRWAAEIPHLDLGADELLDAPQVLAGDPARMADLLRERRERYGFSYLTVFEPAMADLAPVIRELDGE
ncbi:TIGR03621 family F420-dependent LLM class oxidoreductase [Amycolatopsis cihanbeyliensis]|uniref:Putative F420-dependent oxidoreductase n=1 Tax=Amycolatopsis cihanbeyliensis TaxID=1128664 RepID=A0A542DQN2_AMYCI|nr:TIGR03621 family F420-dependent LLM class oxidoreductase [Amycolatopsis cihanbeyliensis]TQJ05408.1 putative F420-dependent oxidoreductase [Amycolatopsis cihanbeyliensis]